MSKSKIFKTIAIASPLIFLGGLGSGYLISQKTEITENKEELVEGTHDRSNTGSYSNTSSNTYTQDYTNRNLTKPVNDVREYLTKNPEMKKYVFVNETDGKVIGISKELATALYANPLSNGWIEMGHCNYHFDKDGVLTTGFFEENDKIIYLNDFGEMQTGWKTIDYKVYNFTPKIGTENFEIDVNGSKIPITAWTHGSGVAKTGDITIGDQTFVFSDNAQLQNIKSKVPENNTSALNIDTTLSKYISTEDNTIKSINPSLAKVLYSNKDSLGWLTLGNNTYRFDENGAKMSGFTNLPDGSLVYLNDDGVLQTGWTNLNGNIVYLNPMFESKKIDFTIFVDGKNISVSRIGNGVGQIVKGQVLNMNGLKFTLNNVGELIKISK